MNLFQLINSLTQSTDLPLLTAFFLGLLVALNPCQLAINVSALTYILKHDKARSASLTYAMGRSATYTLLGWTLMCLIGGGQNVEGVQQLLSQAEVLLPYILIAIGLFMLSRSFHAHHHDGESCHHSGQIIRRNGPLGSLILGMTLALAFCPESAVFYFGLMLPLSMTSSAGLLVPLVFALAASLPVLGLAWLMAKATQKAEQVSHAFEHAQQWLNALTGLLFIAAGILLFWE
ncbi:MAG: sulfite exporter TauE/SafE family protein [Bacteroidaceae bacterium]|nr:sulfite exporter TauE/SafE family protein [Bacteroidaceae bacterium]